MRKITILALHLNYGGIEKMISTLANSLCLNYEVEIISVYKLNKKPVYKLNKNISVKYLLENHYPNREEFQVALKRFNLFKVLKEGFKATQTLYLRKSKTKAAIKESDADVIISSRDIFNKWVSTYGDSSKTLIGWEHNHHEGNDDYVKTIVDSAKNLNYLVLVSKELTEFYQEQLKKVKSSCEVIHIPNMIDDLPKKSSNQKNKKLIAVGRLAKEKGFNDLIDVFRIVNKQRPEWTLDIIGDGAQMNYLVNRVYYFKLQDKITFHGFQDKNYINKQYLSSSIYALTSYTESFGLVVLEAMSFGLPCVAFSSAKGVTELITNNVDGYLIENRNIKAMAKRIIKLIDDEDKRKQMGNKAKQKSLQYTPEIVKEKWIDLIEESNL